MTQLQNDECILCLNFKVLTDFTDIYIFGLEAQMESLVCVALNKPRHSIVTIFLEDLTLETKVLQCIINIARVNNITPPRVTSKIKKSSSFVGANISKFKSIKVKNFRISPASSHDPKTASQFILNIPAGMAFGTGSHETTRGCLLSMQYFKWFNVKRALDLGCGSGILALAAARLWSCKVIAADNDPVAIDVAEKNISQNDKLGLVRAILSAGCQHVTIRDKKFDLVTANIFSGELISMSGEISRIVSPRGLVVLSGLLFFQEAGVLSAYRRHGFYLVRRIRIGDWSTLVVSRPGISHKKANQLSTFF